MRNASLFIIIVVLISAIFSINFLNNVYGLENDIVQEQEDNFISFFAEFWIYIIIFLIILIIFIYAVLRKYQRKGLLRKITRLRNERESLVNLIKKTQEDRYKKNNISELVYNIRMKKYKQKINKIKHDIPVLRDRLRRLH